MEFIQKAYRPSRNQKLAIAMITAVVLIGILGKLLVSDWFMIGAILFWVHYTAILSFMQFRNQRKRPHETLTEILLIPHIRFFVFIFIATIGLIGTLRGIYWLGYIALAAWWLFSFNFYRHYGQFRKYE
ncbi:hypothetical protein GF345_03090 [Candidatus Woesearchaeota archaeon]|nr:hypothetical protein [Candidatus Woesearchaeota archaeon]